VSYAERDPKLVDMARWLHRNADGSPYSLREVAAELAGYGYVTPSGKPYSASAISSCSEGSKGQSVCRAARTYHP